MGVLMIRAILFGVSIKAPEETSTPLAVNITGKPKRHGSYVGTVHI